MPRQVGGWAHLRVDGTPGVRKVRQPIRLSQVATDSCRVAVLQSYVRSAEYGRALYNRLMVRLSGTGIAGLMFLSLVANGCGTANIRADDPYKRDHAYVYGRFTYSGFGQTFAIQCRDGAIYKIHFISQNQVQMIEVVPSVCQLDKIEYGNVSSLAPFRLLQNEFLDPGGVYYVGDYRASGESRVELGLFSTTTHYSFRLNPARDNYEQTTAAMKRAFPSFRSAATQDRVAH